MQTNLLNYGKYIYISCLIVVDLLPSNRNICLIMNNAVSLFLGSRGQGGRRGQRVEPPGGAVVRAVRLGCIRVVKSKVYPKWPLSM